MISRRNLVIGGISIPTGVGLGLWAHTANRLAASIRLIGNDDGILTLLDTGRERVLILSGTIDSDLWSHLPILRTLGRARIDMVIGSYANLLPRTVREGVGEALMISMQKDASLPPLGGNVQVITDYTELAVGAGKVTVEASGPVVESPTFVIAWEIEDTTTLILSGIEALRQRHQSQVHALVVPGELAAEDVSNTGAALIVGAADVPVNLEGPYLQIFPTAVTTITPGDEAISVPKDQLSS
ncbi:MAG: hypothetical protein KC435_01180 [Thermomicrobiales bacterium]|nr:hypothetical protein [Thermomicrobiales bacterium]